ncbi:MAG TPA: RT0821/Lpp0805 family surface protein [Beijerinckiaceae bacterium]|nr:RT0821/Lpp0805 family surface protein [Beijerinckiaceae bacterium]
MRPSTFLSAVAVLVLPLLAGCSLTMPIGSLVNEDEVTGSLPAQPAPMLSPKLDGEDQRRAMAALALAVDPQGNGAPVQWDNPVSRRKGGFVASGALFVKDDRVCRPFSATLVLDGTDSAVHGIACRLGPNDWMLREVKPGAGPG